MRAVIPALLLIVAACDTTNRTEPDPPPDPPPDGPVEVCYFRSGRPCRHDTVCLGTRGAECNYASCEHGRLRSTAIGCGFADVPPLEGGPFDCDPSIIVRRPGSFTPPEGPCPLGSLIRIENNGLYSHTCVPLHQCKPIACDPQFQGDGCPSTYTCDPASNTCVPSSAASRYRRG